MAALQLAALALNSQGCEIEYPEVKNRLRVLRLFRLDPVDILYLELRGSPN